MMNVEYKLFRVAKLPCTQHVASTHAVLSQLSYKAPMSVDEHPEEWSHYILLFVLAYRSSIHKSTHHTPAKVIFDHELRLPCDLMFGSPLEKPRKLRQKIKKEDSEPPTNSSSQACITQFEKPELQTHIVICYRV